MDRELLRQVIADQREYKEPKYFYQRDLTTKIETLSDSPSILIISGLRRSGKSTILRQIQRNINKSDFYFNFDDERLIKFSSQDFQALQETLIELFGPQTTFYFDEIQNIDGWERFVRRLHDMGNKIYITGSNATLLSKELGTHLTGRYIQIEAFPLSFAEIIKTRCPEIAKKQVITTTDTGLIQHHFVNYMKNGGIPEFVTYEKVEYLKDLLDGILFRDIIVRYKIKEENALREVVYYLASNIAKEFSYSNITKLVGLKSTHTVSNFCYYLEQCYLFFCVTRYSPSVKKQLLYNKKCYMIDPALIRITGFRVSEDRGRILENLVFLQLKRKHQEIFFHKETKECDFLIRDGGQITQAIQVTVNLVNEETKEREISGLLEALKTYGLTKGTIITESESHQLDIDNLTITVLPAWKWLMQYS